VQREAYVKVHPARTGFKELEQFKPNAILSVTVLAILRLWIMPSKQ